MKKYLILFVGLISSYSFAVETKSFDASNLTEVNLKIMEGNVVINASDSPTALVSINKKVFSDKCNVVVEKENKKLILKVEKSGFFSSPKCEVDFELTLPKVINLEIAVGAGDIKVNGTQGTLETKLGSGNVVANGKFSKLIGTIGSGTLKANSISSGKVKLGSGSIDLGFAELKKSGDMIIKVGSGTTTLSFPQGSKIKTHSKVGVGNIKNEVGDSSDAEFVLDVKLGAGNLSIKSI